MGLPTVAKIINGIAIAVSFISIGLLAKVVSRWNDIFSEKEKPPSIIGFTLFSVCLTALVLIYALIMRTVSSFSAHRNAPLILEYLCLLILLAGSVSMAVQITRYKCEDYGLGLCQPIRSGNAFSFITWIFLFFTSVIDGIDMCRTRAGMPSTSRRNQDVV